MGRRSAIVTYLTAYQHDMALVSTEWQRGQVQRLYAHEQWMGNWRASWCNTTRTAFAQRTHRNTGVIQWAFPPGTDAAVQQFIQTHYGSG